MKPLHDLTDDELLHATRRAVQALPDVPPALHAAAVALWPGAGAALGALAKGVLAHVMAVLTFDSWAQGASALGMRGGRAPTRHLLFSAEGRDIDLRIAPEDGTFSLAGQILGPDDGGAVEVSDAGGGVLHSAALDGFGEFRIAGLARGTYQVVLRLGVDAVQLPPLEVGEPV